MKVLTNNSLDMSLVSWYVLQAHLMCWPCNPIFCMFALIAENILRRFIADYKGSSSRSGSIETDRMCGSCLRSCLLNLISSILDNIAIDVTSSHAKEIVFGRYKTCISG